MNRHSTPTFFLAAAGLTLAAVLTTAAKAAEVRTYFSPRGGCAAAIAAEIDAAKTSINIMAYRLSSARITKALAAAHARGVAVRLVVDRANESQRYATPGLLQRAGIDVRTDTAEHLMHTKMLVIDGRTTIAGSYNFTAAAETNNAEVLFIITDTDTAAACAAAFAVHFLHSVRFQAKPQKSRAATAEPSIPQHPAHIQRSLVYGTRNWSSAFRRRIGQPRRPRLRHLEGTRDRPHQGNAA